MIPNFPFNLFLDLGVLIMEKNVRKKSDMVNFDLSLFLCYFSCPSRLAIFYFLDF